MHTRGTHDCCASRRSGSRIDLDDVRVSDANAYNYPGFNRTAYTSAWYRPK